MPGSEIGDQRSRVAATAAAAAAAVPSRGLYGQYELVPRYVLGLGLGFLKSPGSANYANLTESDGHGFLLWAATMSDVAHG